MAFSELKPLREIDAEIAHYLVVHKLQYERLRRQTAVGIPEGRFGVIRSRRLAILRKFDPVLFQQRIRGITLWSMYDFAVLRIGRSGGQSFRDFRSTIGLMDCGLRDHVDWNIKNFRVRGKLERLLYVDSNRRCSSHAKGTSTISKGFATSLSYDEAREAGAKIEAMSHRLCSADSRSDLT